MTVYIPDMSQEDSDDLGMLLSFYPGVDLTAAMIVVENIRYRAWRECAQRLDRELD